MPKHVIWKFSLSPGVNELKMPPPTSIVFAGPDPQGVPCLWAEVCADDEDRPPYQVRVCATGEEFDSEIWKHCRTWAQGPFIFHLMVPA